MDSKILNSMGIDYAFLFAAIFIMVIVLMVLYTGLYMQYKRLKSGYNLFMRGKDGKTLEESLSSKLKEMEGAILESKEFQEKQKELEKTIRGCYQKAGLVRYDAFDDIGGNLSCAITLLDQQENGFILNSIHSVDGCYLYMKEIVHGESYVELSGEEMESLERAIFQEAYGLQFQNVK